MKYIYSGVNNTRTIWNLLGLFLIISSISCQSSDPISSIFNFIIEGFDHLSQTHQDTAVPFPKYDYIIVGAGTAGCTLANRLTEDPDLQVLLVEAGEDENLVMDIPVLVNYLQFTPANWKYKTKPSNRYCAGFENKQCNWPRGKVMGGSSVLNYMIYTRGAPQDYDNWESMGNKGWSWNDVLPYFKKIEHFDISSFDDLQYHSNEGHVHVQYSPYRSERGKAWVKAAKQYGFNYGDYNGPSPSGVVSFLQLSMKNGSRHSSNRAYLHPIKGRPNLHVTKESHATRLLFDDTKTSVVGVEIEKLGTRYKIIATKEVILSAGAINSPQILMLSGIGPKEHLKSLGIPVVKDLPVGKNLMDHIAAGGLHFTVNDKINEISTEYILNHLELVFQWMATHNGPLSTPGGCESLIFMELKDKFNTTSWPDMELLLMTSGFNSDPMARDNVGIDKKIFQKTYGPLGNSTSFMALPMLLRPKSKGTIQLRDKNPKTPPVIIPNFFEYEEDLQKIVEGIRVAVEIAKQPALKKIGTKFYQVPIEECLKYGPFGSDEYYQCQTRMFTFTIYHQSGTCKMGPANDPTSVVDSRLRVHGIPNLRVIDASIMPEIVSCHTNAPTYMIAEKGADMIKQDLGIL